MLLRNMREMKGIKERSTGRTEVKRRWIKRSKRSTGKWKEDK